LLESLSSLECGEVLAFAETEPLDQPRADIRSALQALVACKIAGSNTAKLSDFVPSYDPPPPDQSQDEMNRAMMKFTALHSTSPR
jgi:hypothetical protein